MKSRINLVLDCTAATSTFNVECGDLAADRVRVDRATIRTAVAAADVTDQQVPLLEVRSHDAEPRVINHCLLLVCQREEVLIKPGHLSSISALSRFSMVHTCTATYT